MCTNLHASSKWSICFRKMVPAVVGRVLLLFLRRWLTLDTRATPGIALDEFAIFFASTGILDPLLNTHCKYQPQKNRGREELTSDKRWEVV
jgi:hypothetical protein